MAAAVALGLSGVAIAPPALAQSASAQRTYDIAAGPLGSALNQFGRATGVAISYDPSIVAGKTTRGLRGSYRAAEALTVLLRGTGLQAQPDGFGGFVVRTAQAARAERRRPTSPRNQTLPPAAPPSAIEAESKADIVVTGLTSPYARSGLFGEQAVMDTPFSITAYTKELFDTRQARTITDVVSVDPAIRSNLSANSESEQYVLRGFPLFASEVAIEGLYGMLPLRRIPIEPFGKVEVFKGPNALVNGVAPFGNIGGMINLVPKRAQPRWTLDATAVYVSDGQLGGNVDLGGRFGGEQQFGVRLNAAHYDGDLAIDHSSRRADLASLALDVKTGNLQLTADFSLQLGNGQGTGPPFDRSGRLRNTRCAQVDGELRTAVDADHYRQQELHSRRELRVPAPNDDLCPLWLSQVPGGVSLYARHPDVIQR